MQVKKNSALLFLLLVFGFSMHTKHRPIVLVHGVLSDKYGMKPIEHYIQKYLGKDVYIKSIALGSGSIFASFSNMYDQVTFMKKEIDNDPQLQNGFDIIAHSQSGLVARYFIELYNKPRVHTFISWGSPQAGVFGTPGTIDNRFSWLNTIEQYTYTLLYSYPFQRFVSFASYWRDTLHYDTYLQKSTFLPYLNNEKNHPLAAQFKEHLCMLENMILVKSVADDIIEPVESCHFGFYKKGSAYEIEDLFSSDIYQNDTLGLKILHETGRLHFKVAYCTHENFQEDEHNFVENTLPFLMGEHS